MCKKIPREKLIEEIINLSEDQTPPTCTKMKKSGKYSIVPYRNEFGCWTNAVKESGFEDNYRDQPTKEETISEIKRISKEFYDGERPTLKTFKEESELTRKDIKRYFSKWGDALDEIGFGRRHEKFTEEEIIQEIKNVEKKMDRDVLTQKVFENHSNLEWYRVTNMFESWASALVQAGVDKEKIRFRNISEEILIKSIKDISSSGRVSSTEYIQNGIYDIHTIMKRFGSWTDAVEKANLESVGRPSKEEHYNWNGGWEGYYGPSWPSQRKKARLRDQMRCQVCFRGEHEIGRKPDVHHIKPTYKFNIDEEHTIMNNLNNLISLCSKCHHSKNIDGRWQNYSPTDFAEKARGYLEIESGI